MALAVLFSVPAYVLDSQSPATVTGYQVQGSSVVAPSGFRSGWTDLPGSPFASNLNIVDTASDAASTKMYRVKPVLTVTQSSTVYTLDMPFSRAFAPTDTLFDYNFTYSLLPVLRSTYFADQGVPQTNGTTLMETTGPGQGAWIPDGKTTRFTLNYVENDDPIRVLDNWYKLAWTDLNGTPKSAIANTDYSVDEDNGVVIFATAPAIGDYLRFDFRACDFSNEHLLLGMKSGIDGLSQYGINGYQVHYSNNLWYMQKALVSPDLGDIAIKIAIRNIREGLTEQALRADANWKDGTNAYDPEPNRALQFLVEKWTQSEASIRHLANGFIRTNTLPLYRGDLDVMFDMSQNSPVSAAMFQQFSAFTGYAGIGLSPGFAMAFWI